MTWATPQYSRSKVDAAADYLAHAPIPGYDEGADEAKWDEAFYIVSNWRASHSWPLLSIRLTLTARAKAVSSAPLITQRLKRFPTIIGKLMRFERMQLTQMQDVGGCRAVMANVGQVERLARAYQKAHRQRRPHQPECVETYDYLKAPKDDGYRGIHFVYKYHSKNPKWQKRDRLRIEIQLRSQLQHAWATALETVDIFTKQALKSNIGDESWKRFFVLMSAAIALRERRKPPPGVPGTRSAMTEELRDLASRLKVEAVLGAWSGVVERFASRRKMGPGVFLLVLDTETKELDVRHYDQARTKQATEDYEETEKKILAGSGKQAVLVSVKSLQALRAGYPSFFADTEAFLEAMREAIQ